jgi:F-type H+-transporting ATPase subunit c
LIAIGAGIAVLTARAQAWAWHRLRQSRRSDRTSAGTGGKINALLILGMALTESTAIYGFVISLIMIFTMK